MELDFVRPHSKYAENLALKLAAYDTTMIIIEIGPDVYSPV